jgi:uncharacterized Zn finger protein (UPF0148 family)
LLLPAVALARPGGGDLFGGGDVPSSGGGGGGGDVDIGLVINLIYLCVEYPPLGGVVVVGVIGYAVVRRMRGAGLPNWSTGVPAAQVPAARSAGVARSALDRLRANDPDFSVVLLEDFLYTLYAELLHRRPRGGLQRIAAFVAPDVAQSLADPSLEAVTGIVIGTMRLNELHLQGDRVLLGADFESNLTEVRGGASTRSFAVDRVLFSRSLGARSRPPARVRKLDCPNCGAPLESITGTSCGYCRQEVGGGRLDWSVTSIRRLRTESLPELFSKKVEERGNELPTRVDPGMQARFAELSQRDPSFDNQAFLSRVGLVFQELGIGWSNRDLSRVRPYVSDNLFQYFAYFIGLYAERRARNVTENARILHIEPANVIGDAYFDAITVRVFATGLDYTLGDDGRLLHGSRDKERAYTEYWTLIRGRNAKGRARTDPACPQCGAPLRVGMAGNCEYCQARIVSGDFDWVLSRIEQDEVYTG